MPLTIRRVRIPITSNRLKASAPPQSQVKARPKKAERRRFRASLSAPPPRRRGAGAGGSAERVAVSPMEIVSGMAVFPGSRSELRVALAQPLPYELRHRVDDEGEDEEEE